jgi:hypothetical protein
MPNRKLLSNAEGVLLTTHLNMINESLTLKYKQTEFKKMQTRMQLNEDFDRTSFETGLYCPEPTLAVQESKEDVDLNNILRKMAVTGVMPFAEANPTYGDFSEVRDYHTLMNSLISAQNAFKTLPSGIRERFNHDPGQLMAFMDNPFNFDEGVKIGLFNPKPVPPEQPLGE